jgi:hypothetical protein
MRPRRYDAHVTIESVAMDELGDQRRMIVPRYGATDGDIQEVWPFLDQTRQNFQYAVVPLPFDQGAYRQEDCAIGRQPDLPPRCVSIQGPETRGVDPVGNNADGAVWNTKLVRDSAERLAHCDDSCRFEGETHLRPAQRETQQPHLITTKRDDHRPSKQFRQQCRSDSVWVYEVRVNQVEWKSATKLRHERDQAEEVEDSVEALPYPRRRQKPRVIHSDAVLLLGDRRAGALCAPDRTVQRKPRDGRNHDNLAMR